jgi:hypothetical protein
LKSSRTTYFDNLSGLQKLNRVSLRENQRSKEVPESHEKMIKRKSLKKDCDKRGIGNEANLYGELQQNQ